MRVVWILTFLVWLNSCGRFRPQERLKAMLAAWLQEFLGARGRAMLAWEEAFSGRVVALDGADAAQILTMEQVW